MRAQVGDQPVERRIGDRDPIDVDHRHDEAAAGEQRRQRGRLDPRMDVRRRRAARLVGGAHRAAQLRQGVAAGHRADQQRVRAQRRAEPPQRARQIVDRVERADRDAPDRSRRLAARPRSSMIGCAARGARRTAARDRRRRRGRPTAPSRAGQSGSGQPISSAESKRRWISREPLEAVVERALVQEQLAARCGTRGRGAARASRMSNSRLGHAALVRRARRADKRR